MQRICTLILIGIIAGCYQLKNAHYAKIINCYDGDTCTTKEGEKIRLACIDTPELIGSQANEIKAVAARDYLNELIAGRDVLINRITEDRYGRTVAEIYIDGTNVQQILVEEGLAIIYEKYAHQCDWSRSIILNSMY